MKVLKERQLETFIEKLKRRSSVSGGMDDIQETVRNIINDVRKRGDRAVRKYTEKFDSITLKFSYELLEGNGTTSFRTPLATGHAFQGWTDRFLTTPADGVEDYYFTAVVKALGANFIASYHMIESDNMSYDYGDELDLLLAKGRPGYIDRERYSAEECIDLIRQAGGVSVLAHPATVYLPDDQLRILIAGLKERGLGGIEAYYAEHRPENIRKFTGWAEELDLVCTGGTDFHGTNSPDLKLGTGFGQLHVPDEVLDQLKAVIPKVGSSGSPK